MARTLTFQVLTMVMAVVMAIAIPAPRAVMPTAASPDTTVTTAPITGSVSISVNRGRAGHNWRTREDGHRQRQRQIDVKAETNSGVSRPGCRTEQRGHDKK